MHILLVRNLAGTNFEFGYLPSFIFANSKCKYEKRVLKLAIRAFSASFSFSKSLNFLKFLDKLEQAKGIQTNPVITDTE